MKTKRGSLTRSLTFAALLVVVAYPTFGRFEEAYEQTDAPLRFQRGQTEESAAERTELWESGIHVGVQHYGLGAGMMQYLSHHRVSIRQLNPRADDNPLGTHSDFVDLFASYGLLGLFLFLRYTVLTTRDLYRQALLRGKEDYLPQIGLTLFASSLVVSISQNSFTGGEYFLFLAWVESTVKLSQPQTDELPQPAAPRDGDRNRASLGKSPASPTLVAKTAFPPQKA